MASLRILIYTINWFPELSGPGKFSGEMSQWLASQGHDVRVVTTPPYYPEWEVGAGYSGFRYRQETVGGVHVWRCPLYVPRKPSGVSRVLHLLSFAASSFPVVLSQALWKPDVVISIEPALVCAPAAWISAWLCGAVKWLHVQDFEIDAAFSLGIVRGGLFHRFMYGIERLIMGAADVVSSISSAMMQKLSQKGIADERAVFFPNWVDCGLIRPLDVISPYRKELNIGDDMAVALYSGNMGVKQGLEIVVEAAERLKDEKIIFVMCGSGAMYEVLRKRGAELNNIRWLPLQPLERLNDLLNLADVHLLPQRHDAADIVMPSKLTGMLASGKPVLATAMPGTGLANVLAELGAVVPPGCSEQFADRLKSLIENESQRRQMGSRAREFAIEHLDQEVVLRRFEKSLELHLQLPNIAGALS